MPITWEGHEYGFLEIYGARPNIFNDEEICVLEELATNIANALNAVERKEALVSGQSTEVTFVLEQIDDPLFALADRVDGQLMIDSLVPQSEGSWLVYLALQDGSAESVLEACDKFISIEDANRIRSENGTDLLSLTISDFTLVEVLGNYGASIQSLEFEDTKGTVTVTIPSSTDVRSLTEACKESLGDINLIRCVSANKATFGSDLKYELENITTEKQLNALQTGFANGYFEVPREHTGEEVAEQMGVSGPTFQHHVRRGIQRILSEIFRDDLDR